MATKIQYQPLPHDKIVSADSLVGDFSTPVILFTDRDQLCSNPSGIQILTATLLAQALTPAQFPDDGLVGDGCVLVVVGVGLGLGLDPPPLIAFLIAVS